VTPYLLAGDGLAALEFYRPAFGAEEPVRQLSPDGKLLHGRLRLGDSIVMVSDAFPGAPTSSPTKLGGTAVTFHLCSHDVETLWAPAITADARVVMPLEHRFWGERCGQLADPFGHPWSPSMVVEMSEATKRAEPAQATPAFASGEQP
jgi:PhnB protein